MGLKTHLVNYPRRSPEELDRNLPFISVEWNGHTVYSSYHSRAQKKQAVMTAKRLLLNRLRDEQAQRELGAGGK